MPARRGAGRKKGVPNKATRELKAIFKEILEDPRGIEQIRRQYQQGKLPAQVWIRMAEYVMGKPKEATQEVDATVKVVFGGRYK